ncbi:sucrose phosphorylase [Winogradskyella sp.]|uniref:sucrose phosphorylase n=1 Tax=Winogradskyella sp. TaxID=1883156 RepID=UPI0025DD21AB|nr:sucrose phosphorylase [Winogradskyella sp.]
MQNIKNVNHELFNGVMLNAYPDSIGDNLGDIIKMLSLPEFKNAFSLFYILPTCFNSDLDRGFSIIDYNLNEDLVSESDLVALDALNIKLKFDIVLNHLSVASPQFKDLLAKGQNSKYKDFFINWNTFWDGHGSKNEEGIVIPKKYFLEKLFMRKAGLPILNVRFPDGEEQPYWNTFYQEVDLEKGSYLGQMDVNANSPLVWEFYEDTLSKLKSYGCKILRLDAFAYLHKEIGQSNFFNEPGTWDYLERIKAIADEKGLQLLPEIHAEYGSALHEKVADRGFKIYDFFLPGLVIHTLESKSSTALLQWAQEIIAKDHKVVNMLGCHDGIPVLDLKGKNFNGNYNPGLLSDKEIEHVMDVVLQRGGRVKNLYGPDGKKISYYQVNATFYSALGENDQKFLLARAIQLFMPGIPQVWYLDIFAGKNDYKAADAAGKAGHKEINRTNLSYKTVEDRLKNPVVLKQLDLIKVRNTSSAFYGNLKFNNHSESEIDMVWINGKESLQLQANLKTFGFTITHDIGGDINTLSFN